MKKSIFEDLIGGVEGEFFADLPVKRKSSRSPERTRAASDLSKLDEKSSESADGGSETEADAFIKSNLKYRQTVIGRLAHLTRKSGVTYSNNLFNNIELKDRFRRYNASFYHISVNLLGHGSTASENASLIRGIPSFLTSWNPTLGQTNEWDLAYKEWMLDIGRWETHLGEHYGQVMDCLQKISIMYNIVESTGRKRLKQAKVAKLRGTLEDSNFGRLSGQFEDLILVSYRNTVENFLQSRIGVRPTLLLSNEFLAIAPDDERGLRESIGRASISDWESTYSNRSLSSPSISDLISLHTISTSYTLESHERIDAEHFPYEEHMRNERYSTSTIGNHGEGELPWDLDGSAIYTGRWPGNDNYSLSSHSGEHLPEFKSVSRTTTNLTTSTNRTLRPSDDWFSGDF